MRRYSSLFLTLLLVVLPAIAGSLSAQEAPEATKTVSLEKPVTQQGTIYFLLETDKAYSSGNRGTQVTQALVEVVDFAGCYFQRNDVSAGFYFMWAKYGLARGFHVQFEDLPGPTKYFLLYTWDADKGLCEGYINGYPLRLPNSTFEPWKVVGQGTHVKVPGGPLKVTGVTVLPTYLPKEEALKKVPQEVMGKQPEAMGIIKRPAPPINVKKRKGKRLYQSKLDSKESVKDWVLEGPGIISFKDGKMSMRSQTPKPTVRGTGHFNYWCPTDFPNSFVAEWEYQPLSKYGFAIIHFAAKGVNGESIFDPKLPKRDGMFQQYVRGHIMNYYISYYANLPTDQTGRTYGNLRKNNKFYLVKHGPIGIQPGSTGFHKIRLIKDGPHIQFWVDGTLSIDFKDPGSDRYGPVLENGKIGFRQMAITEGAYRNFSVWELR